MSEMIDIQMLVECPITGDLYPYHKCRNCSKYREEFSYEEMFGKEIEVVTMWCDYE
jgi:hypothetical protein